jgi:hypothetical protein
VWKEENQALWVVEELILELIVELIPFVPIWYPRKTP